MKIESKISVICATAALLGGTSFALTGGPAMPEYAKFEQVGADNLVDPNTGNFTYVVPLIEVPGPGGKYPLSLSYQSGIQHGQEASWVGLGWTLNPGSVNRMMRGVPDDYLNGVTTTWNKFSASGEQLNINVGYGPFGLAMSFDANTGSLMGATPSLSVPIPGPIGISLTPNGFTIGISHSIGLASANLTLYDSQSGTSGKMGWSVAGMSGYKSVGVSGSGAGKTTVNSIGGSLPPIAGFSLGLGYTKWKFVLDEHIDDHMCGFLFQNGNRDGFVDNASYWLPSSGPLPQPYLKGTGDAGDITGVPAPDAAVPRQRYERSMMKNLLFPSADIYTVSANGLGGSFEPMVEPAGAGGNPPPEYMDGNLPSDGNRDNEGWYVRNAAAPARITFRMHGDPGGNLLQEANPASGQIGPYIWNAHAFGDQYGSQRIIPVFHRTDDGSKIKDGRLKGFRIFNPDGMIYEFLQPLHNIFSADMVFEDPQAATTNNSIKYMPEKYAYTWLLTAVKGADYVSQSQTTASLDAEPIPGDLGHWVIFKYTTPRITTHATPYSGNMPHEDGGTNESGSKLKYLKSFGTKEVAFLSSIETETHRADFWTDARLDALPNLKNIWENATEVIQLPPGSMPWWETVPMSPSTARPNAAADQYVSARGVPRQKEYTSQFSDFDWEDEFEIPGDWVALINSCRQQFPGNDGLCLEVQLDVRILQGGGVLDYTYGTRVEHDMLPATIVPNSLELTSTGNTRFRARAHIDLGQGEECDWIRVKRAGVNWSRVYALLGETVNFDAITPATGDDAFPFVVNRALRIINLYRKAQPGYEQALVKTIEFDYDYSLCKNTPNSRGRLSNGVRSDGKLTLRSVRTFAPADGDPTTTEAVKPYVFRYQGDMGDVAGNPDYGDEYKKDIWGMHKADGSINNHLVNQPPLGQGYPDPSAIPGVAWNLTEVKTPTGGTIRVQYSRDQYWIAGIGKDPAGAPFLMPDLYTNAPPLKLNGDVDVDQMLKIAPSYYYRSANETDPNLEPIKTPYFPAIEHFNMSHGNYPGPQNKPMRKYPEGPSKPNYIKFDPNSPGVGNLRNGDMLLVVYQLRGQGYQSFNFLNGPSIPKEWGGNGPKATGVLNLILLEELTADGWKIKPLLTADDGGNFYVYKDFIKDFDNSKNPFTLVEFNYYAYRLNDRPTLYGGDVAVTSIQLNDGLGSTLTKSFEYDAFDLRSQTSPRGTQNICTGCGVSSGATFGLPSLYWAKHYRFLPVSSTVTQPGPGKLRLENFLSLNANSGQLVGLGQNLNEWRISGEELDPIRKLSNPTRKLLDQAYFAEGMDGGYYFPSPGISYARTREFYVAQADGQKLAGETEYQFNGLNHAMVNEGVSLGNIANLRPSNDWLVSATPATPGAQGSLDVTNRWAAKKGAMVRMLQRSSEPQNPIVKSEEIKYAEQVTTYSGPESGHIQPAAKPGWVKQTFNSYVAGLRTVISVTHVPNITVGKTEAEYNAKKETDYLAFDPRSGEPLAVQNRLPDGGALVEYREPAHWTVADMALRNRLKVDGEERSYQLAAGETFSRTDFGKVVGAKKTVYASDYNGYWKTRTTPSINPLPAMAVAEYTWTQNLFNNNGLPWSAYTPFTGLASATWVRTKANSYIWRNSQPIQTQNGLGETTLLIPTPHTGHPMATVSGATLNEVLISTFQFAEDRNHHFEGLGRWNQPANTSMTPSRVDFSTASQRIGATEALQNSVTLRTTGRKGLRIRFYYETEGSNPGYLYVRALNANGVILAGIPTHTVQLPVNGGPSLMEFELDWSGPTFSSAAKASIDFYASSGSDLYLNDVRVTPPEALVNTYYYQPETMGITAVIDEAGKISRYRYDRLGRLTEKRNMDDNLLEKTIYKDFQE